jgi:low temperature requirement protein LtrA
VLRDGERVTSLELFFDLVFVLALTQCTALMAGTPTWEGVLKGLLVLGVLWWSWVGYAWLTSVVDPEEGSVRLVMFAAMAALLVAALCVPRAFGGDALLFACAYAVVRAAHIGLFMLASRDDAALRSSVIGLAGSTAVGVGLLVGAAFAPGGLQLGIWGLALLLDMGGRSCSGPRAGSSSRATSPSATARSSSSRWASRSWRSAPAPTAAWTRGSWRLPSWAWSWRGRCGGCTSTWSRSSPSGA